MPNIAEQTLASIVSENHRAASVLEKYNLDFCCRGKKILAEACQEKGIEITDVVNELVRVGDKTASPAIAFNEMSAEQLITYIISRHHAYVKLSMPVIHAHLEKVACKHGDQHPYMKKVFELFSEIEDEMNTHMQKEEQVLFPRIEILEGNIHAHNQESISAGFIQAPIDMMENEHEWVGDVLFQIRDLTHNYTAPDGACNTFKLCLAELKEFEMDLHKHVHLENNILFPKAILMMN